MQSIGFGQCEMVRCTHALASAAKMANGTGLIARNAEQDDNNCKHSTVRHHQWYQHSEKRNGKPRTASKIDFGIGILVSCAFFGESIDAMHNMAVAAAHVHNSIMINAVVATNHRHNRRPYPSSLH